MKTNKSLLLVLGLAAGLTSGRTQSPAAPPVKAPVPADPPPVTQPAEPAQPDLPLFQPPPGEPVDPARPAAPALPSDQGIRLNFRGVPLAMVLDHLSDAAGFIINMETEVEGNVNVWSNQPLSQQETVDLLNSILNQNGYAAIRQGRTLTIVKRDEASKRNIPVKTGNIPEEIPPNDLMVTQIIPIRYANAPQMVANLEALLPSYANLTANESGNALVLTDTQSNIKRMVEIVRALDTAISGISVLRVFPLRYADAKELAEAVTKLFEAPQENGGNRGRGGGFRGFPGFGGGDRGGDGGGRDQNVTGTSQARTIASRVVALADERSNSLIVGAPDEYILSIEQLVREVDVPVDDITELRVFPLRNSDPVEMAALFTELFPDESDTQENNGPRFRFGPPGFGDGGGRGGNNNNSNSSDRMKKQGRVMAVADQRTSSLIVRAASELMPQIAEMVMQLDASPARRQKVYVYDLQNADVQEVEQLLRGMFERSNTQVNRNNADEESALSTRRQNTQTTTSGTFGTSGGLGNSGGLGRNNRSFR